MKTLDGKFTINSTTVIAVEAGNPDAANSGSYLAAVINRSTGLNIKGTSVMASAPSDNMILITSSKSDASLGNEGYKLTVSPKSAVISAPKGAGLFYGVQTLLQLFPPEIFSKTKSDNTDWSAPCVEIRDYPRFPWRGLHLDVGRHFFTKDEVLRFLDAMALHKLNRFHFHLTEDQGWRIEIKKYPKLTEVGAWRPGIGFGLDPKSSDQYDSKGRYGGFFTQKDIKEIVAYAEKRYITVVPEIELPGHSRAALAAYPELSCTGGPFDIREGAGIDKDVYCAGNDKTFKFLEDVLTEVLALFPSTYIHIGGDECPKDRWKECPKCQKRIKDNDLKNEHELQSYFVKRIEKFLNSKKRQIIGWDEILEGGLAPNATVMSWRGMDGGIKSAREGHNVIMTPTSHCYFDYYQAAPGGEPKAIGGFVPLEKVYSFEPVPQQLGSDQRKYILGAQGNLWTEYMPNYKQVEYMAYPRGCALAEVVWTPAAKKNLQDFQDRLQHHTARLSAFGVNYRVPPKVIGGWQPPQMSETFHPLEWDITPHIRKSGEFSVTFQYEKGTHRLDIEWAAILENGNELSRDAHEGTTGGSNRDNTYKFKLDNFKAGAKYTLKASVRSDGGNDSTGSITLKD